jgi:argininosuccinate synthase
MTLDRQLDYARERHVTLPVAFSGLGDRASAPRSVILKSGEAASVDIAFERGAPVGVNGVSMPLLDLLGSLGIIAGAHGVASLAALHTSHDALEKIAVAKPGKFSSPRIAREYLRVLRSGAWFTPAREELDADADAVQQRVSGIVRLRLFDGDCGVGDVQVTPSPRTIVLAKAHNQVTTNDQ